MSISQESGTQPSPARRAQELLTTLNVSSVPIYPRKIAREMGIFVQERAAEGGYDGYLMCADGVWGIMINGAIKSKARKRFTVAHELGHYCISRHEEGSHCCYRKDIGSVDPSVRHDEREANEFAVELLMPDTFFRTDIQQRDIGLDTVNHLATRYGTSMTSTAIKYARSSPDACAVVLSENGKIKYFAYSDGFRKEKRLFLSRNVPLRDGSYAKKLFDTGFKTSEGCGEVSAGCWSTSVNAPDVNVMEHSRCLPAFKQVISLIWFEHRQKTAPRQIAHVLVE